MEGFGLNIDYEKFFFIFGPRLFILYINDMHTVPEKFTFITYADDTTLTCPSVSFSLDCRHITESLSYKIEDKMKKVIDWLEVDNFFQN